MAELLGRTLDWMLSVTDCLSYNYKLQATDFMKGIL